MEIMKLTNDFAVINRGGQFISIEFNPLKIREITIEQYNLVVGIKQILKNNLINGR